MGVMLAGLLLVVGANPEPIWRSDYHEAYERGQAERKPLAVIVARGSGGWDQVSEDGRLTEPVRRLLAADYVCLYADWTRPEGRRLAQLLGFQTEPGLVISSRGGRLQAFRHEGRLAATELERCLRTYAEPGRFVTRTATRADAGCEDVRSAGPPPGRGAPSGWLATSGGRGLC